MRFSRGDIGRPTALAGTACLLLALSSIASFAQDSKPAHALAAPSQGAKRAAAGPGGAAKTHKGPKVQQGRLNGPSRDSGAQAHQPSGRAAVPGGRSGEQSGLRVIPVTPGQNPAVPGAPGGAGAAGPGIPGIQGGPGAGRGFAPGNGGGFNAGRDGRVGFAGSSEASGAGGLVSMDFRGSDINNVLKFFAMAANWQIVPDPALTGPVTIISPKQLTIDQAFQVLQSVLEIRGFSGQIEERGSTTLLKIVGLDRAVQSTRYLTAPALGPDGKPLPPEQQPKPDPERLKNQVVTQVFPIENVDASSLARELEPLINKGAKLIGSAGTNALIVTDTAANVQRVGELVEILDKAASNNEIKRIPLKRADATEVANAINSLFRQVYTRGRGGPPQPGQPGQPQMIPGQPGQPGQAAPADQRAAVVAVADTRTNSVLLVASKDNMERAQKLIRDLDDPEATALNTYTRKMQYADAMDVSDTINAMLSGSVPSANRQGGASFQQRVFGGFGGPFGGGFGGGQQSGGVASTDPFAKVVGNARTNSLLITATKERMDKIDELIKELDVPVPVETTTFVVPLKNAQAQDLAYTLSQAFGTQTNNGFGGFGGFGGGLFNIFGNNNRSGPLGQRQPIQRRQGANGGRSAALSPQMQALAMQQAAMAAQTGQASPNAQDGLHGTMTDQGFVPDAAANQEVSRGQFFFGGGGFGRGGQMATPQFGRGQTGSYVNLLQLRQNVGVVPDINSNSLIITTTPDNMRAIQQIIDSLDLTPRQVMIEVIIAEATLDATQKLGFQFDAKGVGKLFGTAITQAGASNFALGTGATPSASIATPLNPGGQYGVQAANGRFNGLVQALATDNRVRILSTPKIFTSNNQQAQIDVTTNVPIISANAGFGFGTSNNFTQLSVGIMVNVTPRITKDGLVTMDIVAQDTELLGFDTLQTGTDANGRPIFTTAPRTSERSTDTSVSARDGEIIVLGGLMRDNKTVNTNKIPLLGDIPLLGALFRSRTTTTTKTELMIFMVPHVVDGDPQTRAMVQQQAGKIIKSVPELGKEYPKLVPPQGAAPGPGAGKAPHQQPGNQPETTRGGSGTPAGSPTVDPWKEKEGGESSHR